MKIYQGETLEGTMIVTDDNKEPITDLSVFDDIAIMISNKFDDYSVVLRKENLNIEQEKIHFEFSSEQTKKLDKVAMLELKIVKGTKVKIAKQELFCVIDNKIKDIE